MYGLPIPKNSGRWSDEECKRFEEAYQLYGNDWKRITRAVGTRTIFQVRSHAQKFVPKLEKQPRKHAKEHAVEENTLNTPKGHLFQLWLYHSLEAARISNVYWTNQSN